MSITQPIHQSPRGFLTSERPDDPVLFLSPERLHATADSFLTGFPGLTTYAVKANPAEAVIANLLSSGLRAFDVASPAEIALVRSLSPDAALHYNNPVRFRDEIAMAVARGVCSYSVDDMGELRKLADCGVPHGTEVSVRFKLPVAGAAYDFGEKFGATPEAAIPLLQEVVALGFTPAMTFHPGTQCADPEAWVRYIEKAASIAQTAGVAIVRLNVGGGFPARRMQGETPPLSAIFAAIDDATARAFPTNRPTLICEPGRAMVAESVSLALRVKALKGQTDIYLNDGIYGALAEQPIIGMTDRITALSPEGKPRSGTALPRTLWGPTCDSLDRIPGDVPLPGDLAEGDYLLLHGMGAYTTATVTRFNGYGELRLTTVQALNDN